MIVCVRARVCAMRVIKIVCIFAKKNTKIICFYIFGAIVSYSYQLGPKMLALHPLLIAERVKVYTCGLVCNDDCI